MIMQTVCQIAGHTINRNRVWHDALDFRSKCTRCGKPLIRTDKGWRQWQLSDEDERRQPHP